MEQRVPLMDEAEARAWIALVSLSELLPNALDRQLTADAGLINFEYGILSILNVATDRSARMGELAQALESSAPKLSKAVTRLERRGLVERVACPGDGRAINVRMTREGRRTWLQATPPHIALARGVILGDFDRDQLSMLAALIEPIVKKLDPGSTLGKIPPRAP